MGGYLNVEGRPLALRSLIPIEAVSWGCPGYRAPFFLLCRLTALLFYILAFLFEFLCLHHFTLMSSLLAIDYLLLAIRHCLPASVLVLGEAK